MCWLVFCDVMLCLMMMESELVFDVDVVMM